MTSALLNSLSILLALSLLLLLAHSDEASGHDVSCPMERSEWQRTKSGLQPTAIKELNSANSPMCELGSGSSPVEPEMTIAPSGCLEYSHMRHPELEDQLSRTQIPDPQTP